jgi:hypothetical protein
VGSQTSSGANWDGLLLGRRGAPLVTFTAAGDYSASVVTLVLSVHQTIVDDHVARIELDLNFGGFADLGGSRSRVRDQYRLECRA